MTGAVAARSIASTNLWRWLLLAWTFAYVLLTAYAAAFWERSAAPGVAASWGYTGDEVVESIASGSVLAREHGVSVGDHLRFEHPGDVRRRWGTDERITVWVSPPASPTRRAACSSRRTPTPK